MRRLLLITSLLLLLAPATAGAVTRIVVRGGGWGHGIGMSQYGAKGLAEHGRSHRQILAHYYQGTEIVKTDTRVVRVLLQAGRPEIVFDGATRAPGKRLDPRRSYRARARGLSQVELRTARGTLLRVVDAPLRITSATGLVRLRGSTIKGITTDGTFRGALEIRPGLFGGMGAVNALSLDDYIKGVVPGEMPTGWHEEALKAQAVAARSYAIATNRGGGVFDQYPDTRSQVYRGAVAETPRSSAAVEATSNEVISYRGKTVAGFYFSSSGGRTENIENVFYGAPPQPYYTSVEDPYDSGSPRHRWSVGFGADQLAGKLGGLVKGDLLGVEVLERGASPRILWAEIVGTRGRTRVRGATLKERLGLFEVPTHFTAVETAARRAAFDPGFIARMLAPRALVGDFTPTPRARRVVVERKRRGGWVRHVSANTAPSGVYRILLRRAGTYRVRAGRVAGPAVRVR